MDDEGAPLDRLGAQLDVYLPLTPKAIVLFAIPDHPLTAFGVCLGRSRLLLIFDRDRLRIRPRLGISSRLGRSRAGDDTEVALGDALSLYPGWSCI